MTSRNPSSRKPRARRASLALASAALLALVNQAHADSATWLAAPGNGNWAEAANWVGGIAPGATSGTTSADIATFLTSSTLAITVDSGRNIGGITFNANNTYTLTGGPLLLSNGGTIQTTANSASQNINTAIQLQGDGGTYTFTASTPGTSRLTTFGGAISGTSTTGNTSVLTLNGTSGTANALNGVISDGAGGGKLALVKNDVGQWSVATGNTFSGGVTVNAGTLRTGSSGNSNAIFGTGTVTLNGGTLLAGSTTAITINNALSIGASNGTLSFRGGGTFSPTSISGTGVMTLTPSSANSVTVTPTSFQNFAGTIKALGNTPSGAGALFLRLGSAYVQNSGQNAALDLGVNMSLTQQAGTTSTITTTFGSLSGVAGASVGGSGAGSGTFIYSVGGRNEDTSFAGTIVDGGSKTGFTKTGTGTQILAGANTYTGPTSVSGGKLLVTGSLANSTLTIASGGVFGGTGTVGGATSVNGQLRPNTTPIDSTSRLTFTNTLVLAGDTTFDINGANFTGVTLTSADSLTFGGDLHINFIAGIASGTYDLFNFTDSNTGSFASVSLTSIGALTSSAGVWSGVYGGNSYVFSELTGDLTVSAVPEPSTWAAVAGAIGLGFAAWRRRRAR